MKKEEIMEEFAKLAKLHPKLMNISITFNGGSDYGWADAPNFKDVYSLPVEINESVFHSREISYNILEQVLGRDWTVSDYVYGTISISHDGIEVDGVRDEPVPFTKEME